MTSTPGPLAPRPAAWAFVVAAVAALAADAALATLNSLVALEGRGGSWLAHADLVGRGRWVVFALLLVPAAAWFAPADVTGTSDARNAWRAVGAAVMTVPLLWIAATWLVQATLYTVAGRWDIDGRAFLAVDYYRRLLMGYAPWLLGGLVTRALSRHV